MCVRRERGGGRERVRGYTKEGKVSEGGNKKGGRGRREEREGVKMVGGGEREGREGVKRGEGEKGWREGG